MPNDGLWIEGSFEGGRRGGGEWWEMMKKQIHLLPTPKKRERQRAGTQYFTKLDNCNWNFCCVSVQRRGGQPASPQCRHLCRHKPLTDGCAWCHGRHAGGSMARPQWQTAVSKQTVGAECYIPSERTRREWNIMNMVYREIAGQWQWLCMCWGGWAVRWC